MSEWREYRELDKIEDALERLEAKLDLLFEALVPPEVPKSLTVTIKEL